MIRLIDHADPAVKDRVLDLLHRQSAAAGYFANAIDLSFEARDGDTFVGGLVARVAFGWMMITLLAVAPEARGRGWGRQLMAAAEDEARRRALTGLCLDTLTFQAPDFYRALGYSEVGRIRDYAPDAARVFLHKRLDG